MGEIEECEFGDEVSRSVGSALMFSDDIPCPPKAALGTERRFPSKLATFLSQKKEISDEMRHLTHLYLDFCQKTFLAVG